MDTSYHNKENDCEIALRDLFTGKSVLAWLERYEHLYASIIIAPEGLPPIFDTHENGKTYEIIRIFGNTYQQLLESKQQLNIR
jgi:hypothetical protein